MPRYKHVGVLLYHLRVTYGERVARLNPGNPIARVKLSQDELVTWLNQAGYPIGPGSYSDLEAGKTLPRDAHGFFNTIVECLELNEDERQELLYQLGFDVLKQRIGEQEARELMP